MPPKKVRGIITGTQATIKQLQLAGNKKYAGKEEIDRLALDFAKYIHKKKNRKGPFPKILTREEIAINKKETTELTEKEIKSKKKSRVLLPEERGKTKINISTLLESGIKKKEVSPNTILECIFNSCNITDEQKTHAKAIIEYSNRQGLTKETLNLTGEPLTKFISEPADKFFKKYDATSATKGSELEIEIRFGVLVHTINPTTKEPSRSFQTGDFSPSQLERVITGLSMTSKALQIKDTVYIIEKNGESIRMIEDQDGKKKYQRKTRKETFNDEILGYRYAASEETDLDKKDLIGIDWSVSSLIRHRQRTSFILSKPERSEFRVDLTRTNTKSSQPTNEIEIEVIKYNFNDLNDLIGGILYALWIGIESYPIPNHYLFETKKIFSPETIEIGDVISAAQKLVGSNETRFLKMNYKNKPVNLELSDLISFDFGTKKSKTQYAVTVKIDGVRSSLLFFRKGVYLLNSSRDVMKIGTRKTPGDYDTMLFDCEVYKTRAYIKNNSKYIIKDPKGSGKLVQSHNLRDGCFFAVEDFSQVGVFKLTDSSGNYVVASDKGKLTTSSADKATLWKYKGEKKIDAESESVVDVVTTADGKYYLQFENGYMTLSKTYKRNVVLSFTNEHLEVYPFDIIVYNNQNITTSKIFSERVVLMKNAIISSLYTTLLWGLKIRGKPYFMPKFEKSKSFYVSTGDSSNFVTIPEPSAGQLGLLEIEVLNSRGVMTDGLIYQPIETFYTEPSKGSTNYQSVKKWKPQNKLTIDFRLKKTDIPKEYACYVSPALGSKISTEMRFTSSALDFDGKITLPSDTFEYGGSNLPIDDLVFECLWVPSKEKDEKKGTFVIYRSRIDKPKPNRLDVAKSVVESILYPIKTSTLAGTDSVLLKKLQNKLKQILLKSIFDRLYGKDKILLDIGSGQGGDLGKWANLGLRKVYAVDPHQGEDIREEWLKRTDFSKIEEGETQTKVKILQNGVSQSITYIRSGIESKNVADIIKQDPYFGPHVAASFFSLTFAAESENKLRETVKSISRCLRNAGDVFVGMVMDGNEVLKYILTKGTFSPNKENPKGRYVVSETNFTITANYLPSASLKKFWERLLKDVIAKDFSANIAEDSKYEGFLRRNLYDPETFTYKRDFDEFLMKEKGVGLGFFLDQYTPTFDSLTIDGKGIEIITTLHDSMVSNIHEYLFPFKKFEEMMLSEGFHTNKNEYGQSENVLLGRGEFEQKYGLDVEVLSPSQRDFAKFNRYFKFERKTSLLDSSDDVEMVIPSSIQKFLKEIVPKGNVIRGGTLEYGASRKTVSGTMIKSSLITSLYKIARHYNPAIKSYDSWLSQIGGGAASIISEQEENSLDFVICGSTRSSQIGPGTSTSDEMRAFLESERFGLGANIKSLDFNTTNKTFSRRAIFYYIPPVEFSGMTIQQIVEDPDFIRSLDIVMKWYSSEDVSVPIVVMIEGESVRDNLIKIISPSTDPEGNTNFEYPEGITVKSNGKKVPIIGYHVNALTSLSAGREAMLQWFLIPFYSLGGKGGVFKRALENSGLSELTVVDVTTSATPEFVTTEITKPSTKKSVPKKILPKGVIFKMKGVSYAVLPPKFKEEEQEIRYAGL